MKTSIILALLAVGVFLRPQVTPTGKSPQISKGTAEVLVVSQDQKAAQVLTVTEMKAIIGGKNGCYIEIVDNQRYLTCCLDLWIVRFCISGNVEFLFSTPLPLPV